MSKLRIHASALAAALVLAAPLSAQESAPAFVGVWTHVSQGNVIQDAIERGTADMNFVTRPIARRRLRATNDAYATVEVRIANGSVTTTLDGRDVTSPADGSVIRWTREDGEVMQLSTALRDGTLVQTFIAEDGRRENVYSVSPDGRRLTLQVTLRSDRLPAPIVYRLAYDRAT